MLTGTIRSNWFPNCKTASDKELKDQDRGSYEMKEAPIDGVNEQG